VNMGEDRNSEEGNLGNTGEYLNEARDGGGLRSASITECELADLSAGSRTPPDHGGGIWRL